MAVTPQTNATLQEIAQALKTHDEYLIVGHVNPDGDCLGSPLSLMHVLRRLGKHAQCMLAGAAASIDKTLLFLPGAKEILASDETYHASCVIAVDVPTYDRMGQTIAALHEHAAFTVTLDHHACEKALSTLNYIDPDAASTTLIVWKLAAELGVSCQGDVALCAFTGLITDTGRFQYQNTDAIAFRSAAEMMECGADLSLVCTNVFQSRSYASLKLENSAISRMRFFLGGALAMTYVTLEDFKETQAVKADADTIVNTLRSLDGVRVACVLRENEEEIRGSLRSKDATDVSLFALEHGGGGHKAAAGMTLHGDIADIFDRTADELCAYLRAAWKECEHGEKR